MPNIQKELKALYPELVQYSLAQNVFVRPDSMRKDTLTLFLGRFTRRLSNSEKKRLGLWLQQRIPNDSVKLAFE